ncbi:MAG: hypothetical protein ACQETI_07540 [Halobacteriota archaeon]
MTVLLQGSSTIVLVGLIVLMLLFVFLAFLFVRRTMLSLREGYDDSARKR